MQFITTGNRIAVENFTIGDLYTITFTNGNYINSACIGIGGNFVTFQRNEPELLFSLTMETAELVSTIDLYAGGSGTNNYNELTNKPQINDVELVGNKSLAAFGIQPEITEESPLSSALVSGLGSAAAAESSDFATAAQGALAASAVQPAALDGALALKQDALSSSQLDAVNSGITSTDVAQIETNKNNISLLSSQRTTKRLMRWGTSCSTTFPSIDSGGGDIIKVYVYMGGANAGISEYLLGGGQVSLVAGGAGITYAINDNTVTFTTTSTAIVYQETLHFNIS